jgi:hypothetical protein
MMTYLTEFVILVLLIIATPFKASASTEHMTIDQIIMIIQQRRIILFVQSLIDITNFFLLSQLCHIAVGSCCTSTHYGQQDQQEQ